VYIGALALAILSGLLFGIVPARLVLRASPYQVVKSAAGAVMGPRLTLRDMLLVLQISICAVLVISSIVAMRGLNRSLNAKYGFDPRNALTAEIDLNSAGYTADRALDLQKQAMAEIAAIPGVKSVATVDRIILGAGTTTLLVFKDQITDLRRNNAAANSMRYIVSPGYFEAAGTAMLAGRDFTWQDTRNSPRVIIINRQLATALFGSVADAVGSYFKLRDGVRVQVAGVVEDGKYASLTEDQAPALFLANQQLATPSVGAVLIVRSSNDPERLSAAVRAKLRGLEPAMPIQIQTWNQALTFALFPSRMAVFTLGVMGMMGAVLAITGIFGMAAYSVSKRMKELGIRTALGAQRRAILAAALGRALKLLAFGSVTGLALGLLATRVLAFIVYQATPRDPVVLAGAVLAMLFLGMLATWIPAQRALRVDALSLLRED
jgi:predicted permease